MILAQFYNLLPEYGDVLSTFLHYLLIFFQPLILHLYFSKKGLYKGYVSIFLSLLIYLSVSSSETFFSVIISSVTGDDFVNQYWGSYYTIVNILALFFVLKSFDWKNWRYHARTDYGNLANWTNVYEIKYFSWETMVYKNYFTIIKKDNSANTQTTTTTKTNENQATWTPTKKNRRWYWRTC